MNKIDGNNTNKEITLINRFNNRKSDAFTTVYSMYFSELCRFANNIFKNSNQEGCDVIQDIFTAIWSKEGLHFKSLSEIKAYIYISIKNRFKDFLSKNNSIDKYKCFVLNDDNYFVSQIVENEVISLISIIPDILPADCAKIFKLYLEGWDMNDIISEMNISKSSVYAKKQKAIDIIRQKFPNLYLLLFI